MIVIQIVDWRSYLGRHDMKNATWLKLSTALIDDPRLFGLSAEQKWAWIYLLNQAVTHGKSGELRTTLDRLVHFSGVNKKSLQSALEHFVKAGLIEPVDNSAQQLEVSVQQLEVADSNLKPKKVSKKTEVIDLTDEELELGTKWREMALKDYPHREDQESWSPYQFALEARKVRDHLKYDHAQMIELFTFIKFDEFWRPNCAKPSGLFKKSGNGLLKIDNLLSSRKTVGQRKAEIFNEQIKTGEYKPDPTLDMEFINNYKFFQGNK